MTFNDLEGGLRSLSQNDHNNMQVKCNKFKVFIIYSVTEWLIEKLPSKETFLTFRKQRKNWHNSFWLSTFGHLLINSKILFCWHVMLQGEENIARYLARILDSSNNRPANLYESLDTKLVAQIDNILDRFLSIFLVMMSRHIDLLC